VWKENGHLSAEAKPHAPVPVVEFVDRRHANGNGITMSRQASK
jgi:hypothetical protein